MESRNLPTEIQRLSEVLNGPLLPGWRAQSLACPPGRPKDVVERIRDAKEAGVICLLCRDNSFWSVVLMVRAKDNTAHSGQLAFPGGASEDKDGGNLKATAKREFEEEMGVVIKEDQILGALTSLYIPPSHFYVQPFVAWMDGLPEFELQREEVADVLLISLRDLPAPGVQWSNQVIHGIKGNFHVPGWPIGEHVLWGATAMMMAELLEACEAAGFGLSFARSKTGEQ